MWLVWVGLWLEAKVIDCCVGGCVLGSRVCGSRASRLCYGLMVGKEYLALWCLHV